MDCNRCKDLVNPRLDGELPPGEREAFDAHVERCPECRRVFALAKAVDEAVRGHMDAPEPGEQYWDAFTDSVMEKVRRKADENRKQRAKVYLWPALKWGAGAAVAALLVLGVFRTTDDAPRVTSLSDARTAQAVDLPEYHPAAKGAEDLIDQLVGIAASISYDGGAGMDNVFADIHIGGEMLALSASTARSDQPAVAPPPAEPTAPQVAAARIEPAKPGRGADMARAEAMQESRSRGYTARSIEEAEKSDDSRTRSLAARERALRDSIASASMSGAAPERVAYFRVQLAHTLYDLATHTESPTQIDRALFHWREQFDIIARSIGEDAARTRIRELEALLGSQPRSSE